MFVFQTRELLSFLEEPQPPEKIQVSNQPRHGESSPAARTPPRARALCEGCSRCHRTHELQETADTVPRRLPAGLGPFVVELLTAACFALSSPFSHSRGLFSSPSRHSGTRILHDDARTDRFRWRAPAAPLWSSCPTTSGLTELKRVVRGPVQPLKHRQPHGMTKSCGVVHHAS